MNWHCRTSHTASRHPSTDASIKTTTYTQHILILIHVYSHIKKYNSDFARLYSSCNASKYVVYTVCSIHFPSNLTIYPRNDQQFHACMKKTTWMLQVFITKQPCFTRRQQQQRLATISWSVSNNCTSPSTWRQQCLISSRGEVQHTFVHSKQTSLSAEITVH